MTLIFTFGGLCLISMVLILGFAAYVFERRLSGPLASCFMFYLVFFVGDMLAQGESTSYCVSLGQPLSLNPIALMSISTFLGLVVYIILSICFYRKNLRAGTPCGLRNRLVCSDSVAKMARRASVMTLCGVFLILAPCIILGINPIFNPLGFRQFMQSQGMAYIMIPTFMLMKSLGALFAVYVVICGGALKGAKCAPLIFKVALAVSGIFLILSGFSSGVFLILIFYLLFKNLVWGAPIRGILFLIAILMLPFTAMYTTYRESARSGEAVEIGTIVSNFSDGNFIHQLSDRFDYFDLSILGGGSLLLGNAEPEKLADLFIQPIPRALLPDKPLNFSSLMTSRVFPEVFSQGVTGNYGGFNEFLLYFGLNSVFMYGMFWGFVMFVAGFAFKRSSGNIENGLLYLLLIYGYSTAYICGYLNDMPLPCLLISAPFVIYMTRKINFSSNRSVR